MLDLIQSESSPGPEQNNPIYPFMEPTALLLSGKKKKNGIGPFLISTSLEYGYEDVLEKRAMCLHSPEPVAVLSK